MCSMKLHWANRIFPLQNRQFCWKQTQTFLPSFVIVPSSPESTALYLASTFKTYCFSLDSSILFSSVCHRSFYVDVLTNIIISFQCFDMWHSNLFVNFSVGWSLSMFPVCKTEYVGQQKFISVIRHTFCTWNIFLSLNNVAVTSLSKL